MKTRSTIQILTLLAALSGAESLIAQGSLTPPAGTPGPQMKSLQELWDKLQMIENQNTTLQAYVGLLMADAGISLTWQISTVASAGDIGEYPSLAFGPDGQPAIACYERTSGDLKLARFDGANWTVETVDSTGDVGQYASLAFAPDGQPAIAYYDATNGDLKYRRWDGASWTTWTVESAGVVGRSASLKFGPGGQPGIAYLDSSNSSIKYAYWSGLNWVRQTVDTSIGWAYASLAYGPDGQPAIAYKKGIAVTCARYNGSIWTPTEVQQVGGTGKGETPRLAFGSDGQPRISFSASDSLGSASLATFNGSNWGVVTIASSAYRIFDTSLAIGPNGQPAVSYREEPTLKIVRQAGNGPSETVSDGINTAFTSLAFGPDGQPAIAFHDATNGNLMIARMGTFQGAP